jgi:hypothetical protein
LHGDGEHQIDRYFHFAPGDIGCDKDTKIVQTMTHNHKNLALIPVETDGLMVDLRQGGAGPTGGWVATGYEKKIPAPLVCWSTRIKLPAALHTLIVPFNDKVPDIQVQSFCDIYNGTSARQVLQLKTSGSVDVLYFGSSLDPQIVDFYNGWQTNGRAAYLRLNSAGSVRSAVVIEGSMLMFNGKTLLQSNHRAAFAAVAGFDADTPCSPPG